MRWLTRMTLLAILALHWPVQVLGQSTPAGVAATQPATQPAEELAELVTAYFKANEDREAARALRQIRALPDIGIEDVAKAIREAKLWSEQEPGRQELVEDAAADPPSTVTVEIPRGYDPAKAYPLLLALCDNGETLDAGIKRLKALLGDGANQFILAATVDLSGCWFGAMPAEAGRPVEMLERIRRQLHVDTSRVYLLGSGRGGHAAFSLAALQSHWIAGAIVIDGTLPVQFSPAELELLLPNLEHTPVVVVYGDKVAPEVRMANVYIAQFAEEHDLPIRMLDLESSEDRAAQDLIAALDAILKQRQPQNVSKSGQWFRYVVQGRCGWLRGRELTDGPWTAQYLDVRPAMGEGVVEATRAVLEEKLGFVGGSIEGQTVRVQTRGCEEIELLISADMLDLSRDVVIYVDGTIRYEKPVNARIETMLELAREDWEFQRLWSVRLRIARKGLAIQY